MFDNHVPSKYRDLAPKVVRDANGMEVWEFQGAVQGSAGLNAVVSWPKDEWGLDPTTFAEMRPGAYDVNERIRDMNHNGVLASMNFPTMAGFSGKFFHQAPDKDLALVMLKAYNDWHIDEWCASHPGRFLGCGLLPLWDPAATVAEIRRLKDKGFYAVTLPEMPHLDDWPSYHNLDYWGPVFDALSDTGLVMCLHIGQGFAAIRTAPEAPIDNLIILSNQVSLLAAQDYPHSDSVWPGAPEFLLGELNAAGCSDEEIDKITWQNSARFLDYSPFDVIAKENATVGALRALSPDVDETIRSRSEWRARYEKAAALRGVS
jgi:predicted TIM-barrel fold metal-dependent hydrolase